MSYKKLAKRPSRTGKRTSQKHQEETPDGAIRCLSRLSSLNNTPATRYPQFCSIDVPAPVSTSGSRRQKESLSKGLYTPPPIAMPLPTLWRASSGLRAPNRGSEKSRRICRYAPASFVVTIEPDVSGRLSRPWPGSHPSGRGLSAAPQDEASRRGLPAAPQDEGH